MVAPCDLGVQVGHAMGVATEGRHRYGFQCAPGTQGGGFPSPLAAMSGRHAPPACPAAASTHSQKKKHEQASWPFNPLPLAAPDPLAAVPDFMDAAGDLWTFWRVFIEQRKQHHEVFH